MNRPTNEVLGRLAFLVNTRGIIPDPIDATRINSSLIDVDGTTAILYTVPDGKRLFIDSFWVAVTNNAAGTSGVHLIIRDTSDVQVNRLFLLPIAGNAMNSASQYICPAIEVTAGYDVCIKSDIANCKGHGGIFGWLESV